MASLSTLRASDMARNGYDSRFSQLNNNSKSSNMSAIAGIFAGIGSAVASGIGQSNANRQNKQLFREQLEWSDQQRRLQNAETWKMWNAENEYNSPANQRALWEEAGFSPYAALGQSSSAGSMTSASGTTPSAPTMAPVMSTAAEAFRAGFDSVINAYASMANAFKTTAEGQGQVIQNDVDAASSGADKEKRKAEAKGASAEADKTAAEAVTAGVESRVAKATEAIQVESAETALQVMKAQHASLLLSNHQQEIFLETYGLDRSIEIMTKIRAYELLRLNGLKTEKEIDKMIADITKTEAETAHVRAQTANVQADTVGKNIANAKADADFKSQYGSTPEEVQETIKSYRKITRNDLEVSGIISSGEVGAARRSISGSRSSIKNWQDQYDRSFGIRVNPKWNKRAKIDVGAASIEWDNW